MTMPAYFKNSFEHMESVLRTLKRGRVRVGTQSPGGRNVYVVEYGEPNHFNRTANYSSALGAGDVRCFADKTHPCAMFIGGVHGGEFEGIAGILNLFSLLENGCDLLGRKHPKLLNLMEQCHLIFVPCANPDGRARVPFESVAGMPLAEFRRYDQGVWADGTTCDWPECKRIHPIQNISVLGGYFNDDGINLMHDDFFNPMAKETSLLLELGTQHAPDIIANLHGAANMGYGIYAPGYAAAQDRDGARRFEAQLGNALTKSGFRFIQTNCFTDAPEFNLTTALYLTCGGLSLTWESYQGVVGPDGAEPPETVHQDILDAHLLFFEQALMQICQKEKTE